MGVAKALFQCGTVCLGGEPRRGAGISLTM
jgi:hypothetical protein